MRAHLRKLPGLLVGAALFFIGAAIAGIIGNRADALLVDSFPWLSDQLERDIPVWWAIACVLGALGLALVGLYIWQRSNLGSRVDSEALRTELEIERTASNRADQLVRMGDTLLRLLARLGAGDRRDAEFERLLEEYLRDATGVFGGEVSRGMILHRSGNVLKPWVGFQMPESTMERSLFRVAGSGREARGIAGLAFLSGEPKVVHIEQDGRRVVSDMPNDYIVFDDARPFPPYRSFIAAPIPGRSANRGVVCFDSMRVDAFDAVEIQALVVNMARQMGYALDIYGFMDD